jgi:hypothetical protein
MVQIEVEVHPYSARQRKVYDTAASAEDMIFQRSDIIDKVSDANEK